MTKEERDTLAIVGLILAIIAIIWQIARKWPGIGDAIKYIENGSFLQPLPVISVPTLESGDIVFNLPAFLGDPFAGTPVAQGAGAGCGCQPYKCPENRVEFVTLPPIVMQAATNIVPPQSFEYQAATLPTTCAWNAQGYLDANPDVRAAFGTAGELKFRKKRKYPGTMEAWARFHYNEWGAGEGRSWNC